MKTWEMLKELTENPGKIFQATNKHGNTYQMLKNTIGYFELTVFDKNGKRFDFDVPAGGFHGNIHEDYDWKLLPQEVTWQEALEAWINKERIEVWLEGSLAYRSNPGYKLGASEKDKGYHFDRNDFTKGVWYIL